MFASANAGADGSETNGVAGSDGTRRGRKYARLQHGFCDRGGGESARADMHELTAGQGILGHEVLRLPNFRTLDFSFGTSKLPGRNYATGGGELVKRFSRGGRGDSGSSKPARPLQGRTTRLPCHLFICGSGGSLLEFRGPVCQQRDGSGFGVVGGLDHELFCVGAYIEADSGEVWQIELE